MITVILSFAPFILVLWLANLGERLRERDQPFMTPVIVSYMLLIVLYMFFFLFGLVALLGSIAIQARPEVVQQFAVGGRNPLDAVDSWAWLSWGTLLPSVVGLILMTKPLRRFVARFTSLDPIHPVHAVALSMTMLPIISLALALGVGLGNLSVQIAEESAQTGTPPVPLGALWVQALMFLLMALIGVGWLSRRTLGETLARLWHRTPYARARCCLASGSRLHWFLS